MNILMYPALYAVLYVISITNLNVVNKVQRNLFKFQFYTDNFLFIRSVRPCRNMRLLVLQIAHKDRTIHLSTDARLSRVRQRHANGGILRLC